jgi:hypothetical protein
MASEQSAMQPLAHPPFVRPDVHEPTLAAKLLRKARSFS